MRGKNKQTNEQVLKHLDHSQKKIKEEVSRAIFTNQQTTVINYLSMLQVEPRT